MKRATCQQRSPCTTAPALRTEEVAIRPAAPRARAERNAGLSTIDDIRLASRQRCASPRRRRSGVVMGHAGCPPLLRCGSHRCACCRPDPRRPASAPGSRSRGASSAPCRRRPRSRSGRAAPAKNRLLDRSAASGSTRRIGYRPRARDLDRAWRAGRRSRCCSVIERATTWMLSTPLDAIAVGRMQPRSLAPGACLHRVQGQQPRGGYVRWRDSRLENTASAFAPPARHASALAGAGETRARVGAFFLGDLARCGGVRGLPSCGRDIAGAVQMPDLPAGASARQWGGVGSAPRAWAVRYARFSTVKRTAAYAQVYADRGA
jgi:hypothetical protein